MFGQLVVLQPERITNCMLSLCALHMTQPIASTCVLFIAFKRTDLCTCTFNTTQHTVSTHMYYINQSHTQIAWLTAVVVFFCVAFCWLAQISKTISLTTTHTDTYVLRTPRQSSRFVVKLRKSCELVVVASARCAIWPLAARAPGCRGLHLYVVSAMLVLTISSVYAVMLLCGIPHRTTCVRPHNIRCTHTHTLIERAHPIKIYDSYVQITITKTHRYMGLWACNASMCA